MSSDLNAKMLERVRALLAKAESTEYPAEAESFRAKADELMTRYSINQWAVQQAEAGRGTPTRPERREYAMTWRGSPFRRDLVELFESVALHCRCVTGWRGADYREGTLPVYGLASDLDYMDLLFTQLELEVAKNLQPPVDPNGELGEQVFKQRQAGIAWPEITRKVYNAGLVSLTPGELKKQNDNYWTGDMPEDGWEFGALKEEVWTSVKNRLANANRRYVRDAGLQGERNYVKPEVYQRSFIYGFRTEIRDRLWAMADATRTAYDADHNAGSMDLAVRDMRTQALDLYRGDFPPPPPVKMDPNAKPPKMKAIKMREVRIDYGSISKGKSAGRSVDLANNPGRRVGGDKKGLNS